MLWGCKMFHIFQRYKIMLGKLKSKLKVNSFINVFANAQLCFKVSLRSK